MVSGVSAAPTSSINQLHLKKKRKRKLFDDEWNNLTDGEMFINKSLKAIDK